MTLRTIALGTLIALAAPMAMAQEIPEETVSMITDKLTEMNCQMDPDDIEMTDGGGYDLDDVICEGGNQFDIELDADLNEVGRRAE